MGRPTWQDADAAPGPQTLVGSPVYFRFVVTNTGNVPLSNVVISDNVYTLAGCTVPNPLQPGQSHTCLHGPVTAVAGQHTNTATVTGVLSEPDPDRQGRCQLHRAHAHAHAHPDRDAYRPRPTPTPPPTSPPHPPARPRRCPRIPPRPRPRPPAHPRKRQDADPGGAGADVEKYVSVDGQTTWQDADSPPGPQTAAGNDVYFRFEVTNSGNVPLSNVTLSDSDFTLNGCSPAQPC